MFTSSKPLTLLVFLGTLGSLSPSSNNNLPEEQGVPLAGDMGALLLAARAIALGEAPAVPQMQLVPPTEDVEGTAQQPSSPPVLVGRRSCSAALFCTPEHIRRSLLAAAVAANDIVAVEVALNRGEHPTSAMLQESEFDSEIIELLRSYLPTQSS